MRARSDSCGRKTTLQERSNAGMRKKTRRCTTGLGVKVYEDRTLELDYVGDDDTADAIATDRLFFLADDRTIATMQIDPVLLKTLNIGQVVELTHFAGLGADGFEGDTFLIAGHRSVVVRDYSVGPT